MRDYGNRMGIPTVNGGVCGRPGYVGNPLVFCGHVGSAPAQADEEGRARRPDRRCWAGATGRDGIHGATFSSAELTRQTEIVSSAPCRSATRSPRRSVLDALLQRATRAVPRLTDCGAGGFSSAVGEMGDPSGAEVDLETAPAEVRGLSSTEEIWISEAQERMVLAVPPAVVAAFKALAMPKTSRRLTLASSLRPADSSCAITARSWPTWRWSFLHQGQPRVVRQASFTPPPQQALELPQRGDLTADLLALLEHWDVCSKEWIVRQYDQVQGRTVIKPLVGWCDDGPGDAAVILPVRGWYPSRPGRRVRHQPRRYGRLDPFAMAACVIDEAVRNCVAVGAHPRRIALLDNFCWGSTECRETLGSLVLAAQACHDLALAYKTPFISGKDSLNNEYAHERKSLAISATLLISAIGQVPDVRGCVTMDFKEPGNRGAGLRSTRHELEARSGRPCKGKRQVMLRRPRSRSAGVPGRLPGDQPRAGPEVRARLERRRLGRRPGRADGHGRWLGAAISLARRPV